MSSAMDVTLEATIDEKLEEIGKTAYWLANEIGVDHATLSQIRKNENKSINRVYFGRICQALDCQPGDLLRLAPASKETKAKSSKGTKAKSRKAK
jgi:putative transcriptional regulator